MQRDNNIPKGYKPSSLGPIPNDWDIKRIGEVCSTFRSGQGITSERIFDDGDFAVYGGNGLRGYTNNFTHEGNYLLIGRQGALCGNIILIHGKNYVSEHAIAVQANDENDLLFLGYKLDFLNLNRYSESSAQPGLSVEKLVRLRIALPQIKEQTAIANLLNTWDKAINTLTQLIAQKELRKKWLMQQLLTGKKRLKGFKEKWEEVELGELLNYEQPTRYLVKDTLYNDKYPTPVLTAGKTFVLGYTNEENGICTDLPVIIFDDFTTASKYVDFPFKAKSSAMKLLRPKATANVKFVFEAMQLMKYAIGGHERHWISKFVYLTIPCPPIEEQTAIARVLQSADAELKLLNQKLDKLKEQKKGLMQVLLTGKKRLNY